jgi:hypothetical protein
MKAKHNLQLVEHPELLAVGAVVVAALVELLVAEAQAVLVAVVVAGQRPK